MAETSRPRILFVDDEPLVRRSFERVLREHGFDVDCVADGTHALAASAIDYSVVVVDLCLPRTDGLSLIRDLREHHPAARFVLVTGSRHLGWSDAAKLKAVDAVLSKPWNETQLVQLVRQAASRPNKPLCAQS